MLAKAHKLNSTEFTRVFMKGVQVHTPHLFIKYLARQDSFKTAASVTKKHVKTAVVRNYKRRQVYHALEKIYKQSPRDVQGLWIVVTLKKEGVDLSFQAIETELGEVIKKITQQ